MIFPVSIRIDYDLEASSLDEAMGIAHQRWLDLGNYDFDRNIHWCDAELTVNEINVFEYDNEKYA